MGAVQLAFNRVKNAFDMNPNPDYSMRKHWLQQLRKALRQHEQALISAMSQDFGGRSEMECRMADLMPSYSLLRYSQRNLSRWMRPENRHGDLSFWPARAWVEYQPLGVVGIIVPWNYPVNLALLPLITALAAGNRVLLKLSELTPQTNQALRQMLSDAFADEEVGVVEGGPDIAAEFAALPFNHLLFTGSTAVGRKVMQSAAANLTPVTLELGGKSPVLIAPDIDIARIAPSIVFGKALNAGQTCVAPDYVLCPEERQDTLIAEMQAAFARQYPDALKNEAYTSVISDAHFQRLMHLLNDAQSLGAQIIPLQTPAIDPVTRRMVPHLITHVTEDMQVMQEEIFGPILPVVTYRAEEAVLTCLQTQPRPLALYLFDRNQKRIQHFLQHTHSGGVTINDTVLHVAQDDLPFGGIGASGMGHYHGYEGFLTFSKLKPVFEVGRYSPLPWLSPPYGKLVNTLLRLMLRK